MHKTIHEANVISAAKGFYLLSKTAEKLIKTLRLDLDARGRSKSGCGAAPPQMKLTTAVF